MAEGSGAIPPRLPNIQYNIFRGNCQFRRGIRGGPAGRGFLFRLSVSGFEGFLPARFLCIRFPRGFGGGFPGGFSAGFIRNRLHVRRVLGGFFARVPGGRIPRPAVSRRLFLFHRKAERAELFAEGKVFAVGICEQVRALQVQFAAVVDERRIDVHRRDVGKKHIVRAERDDVGHPAFERHGRLGKRRTGYGVRRFLVQSEFCEFIDLCPGQHAAGVGHARKLRGRQVDDELPALADEMMGISRRAHRNIGFRRIAAKDPCPCDGQNARMFHGSRRNQRCGNGSEQCAALPLYF